MKKYTSTILPVIFAGLLIFPLLSFHSSEPSAQRWEKLGHRKVNFKADRDVISGWGDGIFTALQIRVNGGSISMQKMVIHFRNGQTKEVPLKNIFKDGGMSRVIDLPGNRRLIDEVVFWYEANSTDNGGKPVVELWGRH